MPMISVWCPFSIDVCFTVLWIYMLDLEDLFCWCKYLCLHIKFMPYDYVFVYHHHQIPGWAALVCLLTANYPGGWWWAKPWTADRAAGRVSCEGFDPSHAMGMSGFEVSLRNLKGMNHPQRDMHAEPRCNLCRPRHADSWGRCWTRRWRVPALAETHVRYLRFLSSVVKRKTDIFLGS